MLSRCSLAIVLAVSLTLILLSEFRAIVWFRGIAPPRLIIAKSTILWYVDKTLHQSITDAAGNVVPPPAGLAPPGISSPAPNTPRYGVHLLPVSPYDTRAWLPQRDASASRPYVYTIAIPLPLIAVPAAILLLFAASPRRYLRRRRGQCLHCGYDLRSLASARCPECGSPTDSSR